MATIKFRAGGPDPVQVAREEAAARVRATDATKLATAAQLRGYVKDLVTALGPLLSEGRKP